MQKLAIRLFYCFGSMQGSLHHDSAAMHMQVIGRYLSGRPREQWQHYIDQEPADIGDDPIATIHEVIRPSYLALPSPVKRCFLTFAAFREGEYIRESELLDLWAGWELVAGPHAYHSAQSFLHQLQDLCLIHIHMKEFGLLVLRNSRNSTPHFYMHDVLWELACSIAQGQKAATGRWGEVNRPFLSTQVCSCHLRLLDVAWMHLLFNNTLQQEQHMMI
jgi:hypothetical protein